MLIYNKIFNTLDIIVNNIILNVIDGLNDALSFYMVIPIFLECTIPNNSRILRKIFFQTFLCNIIIFTGYIAINEKILSKILFKFILTTTSDNNGGLEFIHPILDSVY
jgi:hypothetical protein